MIVNTSIRDLFQIIVANVTTVDNPLYFEFGYWPEISMNLKSRLKDPTLANARYPFLMLSAGWVEKREQEPTIFSTILDLELYLVAKSTKNLSTNQRETDIYQAIIEPLYQKVIEEMKHCNYFAINSDLLPHEIEKLYYLRGMEAEDANKLSDFTEALQIKITELKVFKQYTCEELNVN